jgi:hypothetical protein
LPDRIFEPGNLDGIVVAKALEFVREVGFPECREPASVEQILELLEEGKGRGERIGLVKLTGGCSLIQQGYTKVEIRLRGCSESLDEDVDHDVWIVKVGVELISIDTILEHARMLD